MPDSIDVSKLPPDYDAYLGYVDGRWPTGAELIRTFPNAELVLLTVAGTTTAAHGARISSGADDEPGDLTAQSAAAWAGHKLHSEPLSRPVLYASVSAMPELIGQLRLLGIDRSEVRLLSAHYGWGPHICGPASCGEIAIGMDGTQWTDQYPGPFGPIDMSMLADDFFTGSTGLSRTERIVRELGTVQAGMTGEAVKTVQGLCIARGANHLVVDGIFGNQTLSAVKFAQSMVAGMAVDGIVGPLTWPVLLGIA